MKTLEQLIKEYEGYTIEELELEKEAELDYIVYMNAGDEEDRSKSESYKLARLNLEAIITSIIRKSIQ